MARILITGAAGFIGSHTVERLLDEGHEVWGIDNFRTGKRENLARAVSNDRFRFEEIDYTKTSEVDEVIAAFRPTALIHLAALTSVPESFERPEENDRLNYIGTKMIADSCLRGKVSRIVYSSSAAVYGSIQSMPLLEDMPCEPLSPYGKAKLASEKFLLALASREAVTVRCHRYFNVYGPRQDPKSPYSGVISLFSDAVRAGVPPRIFGDGLQSRDFISVHDVVRANVIAATAPTLPSGVANICTGSAVTLNQLLSTIQRLSGTSLIPSYRAPRIGDIRHSRGAPDRARKQLGFEASVTLDDGIAELINGRPLVTQRPVPPS